MVHVVHGSSAQRREDSRSSQPHDTLKDRSNRAAAVAALHADAADRDARFPEEAFASLRGERLLGIMAPPELGGEGASVSDVANVCYALGRVCSATAMIYAMHQTMVACLVRFGRGNLWQEGMLRRLVREQLLLASSTTEGSSGGDLRTSEAPIELDGAQIKLERAAMCISYGAHADCIVTTARRSPDAANTQQVLAVFAKEDYTLEKRLAWDTLGMRGTCSTGFILKARGVPDQILSAPFDNVNARCMMPVAHILWSAAWAGIAAGALDRARSYCLRALRNANGKAPASLTHLTSATGRLETLRSLVAAAAKRFEDASMDDRALDSIDFQSAMALLKVEASETAVTIAMTAMRVCGLYGYRNDTEFSIGRFLRDLLSSPLMISNDRILGNAGARVLLCDGPLEISAFT